MPDFLAVCLVLRDIDKVDELMADITEQQEVAQQISDAISRPVGFGDVVDEVIGSEGSGIWKKAGDQPEGMPKRIVGQVWGRKGTPKVVCFWK